MNEGAAPAPDDREMELFDLAAAAAPEDRERVLLDACPESPELRSRVMEMLEWEERMGGFLERPFFSFHDLDPPFTPGMIAADRFEIRREIAEGGMARVYEAFDRRLGQVVALKVPSFAYRKRLLGELRNAIRVTHTNICRVHEVNSTTTSDGRSIDFLTMEYLDGDTLAARMESKPGPIRDVQAIAGQICAGLAEAHAHDIVHGDLKPNNVILAANGKGGERAVITDFGLAQALAPDLPESPFGASLRGSADYIAPERWQGQRASKAADVYALGVILFEMLTRRRPGRAAGIDFTGVPYRWRKLVRSCLASEPERRPKDAAAVLAALPKDRSRAIAITALLVLAGTTAYGSWMWQQIPVVPEEVRLAVLMADTDPPSSVIGNGVASDVSERLVRTEGPGKPLVLIPVEKANRYHVGNAEASHRVLGATHALSLRWRVNNGRFGVHITVADAQTRRELATSDRVYNRANLNDVIPAIAQTASAALRRGLSAGRLPASYADYAEGLYYLRQAQDVRRTREVFEKLARAAPNDLWIGLRLAQADALEYSRTKSETQRDSIRAVVDRLSPRASQSPDTLLILASLEDTLGRQERALELYTKAGNNPVRQGPASRGAAAVLQKLGRIGEAERVWLQAITAEPGYFQPRMDLGVLYFSRGRYAEARDQFTAVTNTAPGLAIPHYDLAAVLVDLGDYARAEQEYHQALSIEEDPDTLTGIGGLLAYQKRESESVSYYERAVASGPEDPLRISNLADSYRRTGRTKQAAETYTRVLGVTDRRLAADASDAFARAFRAWALTNLGRRREALREIRRSLEAEGQIKVLKRAVLVFDALGMQNEALRLLEGSPKGLFSEIARYPDLTSFVSSERFIQVRSKSVGKEHIE